MLLRVLKTPGAASTGIRFRQNFAEQSEHLLNQQAELQTLNIQGLGPMGLGRSFREPSFVCASSREVESSDMKPQILSTTMLVKGKRGCPNDHLVNTRNLVLAKDNRFECFRTCA